MKQITISQEFPIFVAVLTLSFAENSQEWDKESQLFPMIESFSQFYPKMGHPNFFLSFKGNSLLL